MESAETEAEHIKRGDTKQAEDRFLHWCDGFIVTTVICVICVIAGQKHTICPRRPVCYGKSLSGSLLTASREFHPNCRSDRAAPIA